jgi:hypothetical protein
MRDTRTAPPDEEEYRWGDAPKEEETVDLFEQIKAAGIPFDNHESDLYVLVTPGSRKIIAEACRLNDASTFISQLDGKLWYDVPFAYQPFWDAKAR